MGSPSGDRPSKVPDQKKASPVVTIATITECQSCDGLKAFINGVGSGKVYVPGTGRLDCPHGVTEPIGEVHVPQLVHLALSTLLRAPEFLADRDTAHTIQEWLKVPANMRRTNALPYVLTNGHDVSSMGLAAARILARTMSAITVPGDAFYWRAAANVMRRRLP